jgi:hypothetical protein
LLDSQDNDAVNYAIFLYKLITLEKVDEFDIAIFLNDVYQEIKEEIEKERDAGELPDVLYSLVMEASSLNLKPVLTKASKVCCGFDGYLLYFAFEQFKANGDINSQLALLRHNDQYYQYETHIDKYNRCFNTYTYFDLLNKVNLGIPLNWTIDLLKNKHSYEYKQPAYIKALDIWNTIVTVGVWDLSRDQRCILLATVTNSEGWPLNIDKVHSLANSGSTLASWFLGEILLSGVSQSPDQFVNELSNIVMSCLSESSLLQNKKSHDYITKYVLAFPEQRIDSYLDELIKAHQQLHDDRDECIKIEYTEDESLESAESIIAREKAQEDWGESFDDIDTLYWESYLGGPDDEYWERED